MGTSTSRDKVFISYRRTDSRDAATAIRLWFGRRLGDDAIFQDLTGIEPGDDFPEILKAQLAQARHVLVVIGPGWFTASDEWGNRRLDDRRDWVRWELEYALNQKSVTVIPLLLDGAKLPSGNEVRRALPESLVRVASRNGVKVDLDRIDQCLEPVARKISRDATGVSFSRPLDVPGQDVRSDVSEVDVARRSLRILGPVEIRLAGRLIVAEPRPRLLFVMLALAEGQAVPEQQLVDAVWGTQAAERKKRALGTTIAGASGVAAALGMEIGQSESSYMLRGSVDFVDLREFARLESRCLDGPPATRLVELREADALWRGSGLADLRQFPGGHVRGVELDRRREEIRDRLLEALVETGAFAEAIAGLTDRARADEWDIRVLALLAQALYGDGRQAQALELVQSRIKDWRDDRGLDPPDTLCRLESTLKNGRLGLPPRSARSVPVPTELAGLARDQFFGRRAELAGVWAVLNDVVAIGRSRIVRLQAEPGSGKSHLLAEMAKQAGDDGWRCLYASCEDGISPAYAPLRSALRLDAVEGKKLDAEIEVGNKHKHLREALRQRAATTPLLLLLDDCHWLDEPSRTFLRALDRTPLASPVVVCMAERTPVVEIWGSGHLAEIILTSYTRDEVREIADAHGLDQSWVDAVVSATDGLPLLVHDAVGRTGAELLSPTVAARSGRLLLADRWRFMNEAARDVVRQAAALGDHFTLDQLVHCCEADADTVFDAVDTAYRNGIFRFDWPVARRCNFSHATMRAGVLDAMPPALRSQLHCRVLDRLKESFDELSKWNHANQAGELIDRDDLVDFANAAVQRLLVDLSFADALVIIDALREHIGDQYAALNPDKAALLCLVEGKVRATVRELGHARKLFEECSRLAASTRSTLLRTESDVAAAALGYSVREDPAMRVRLVKLLAELPSTAPTSARFDLLHQITDSDLMAARYIEADDEIERLTRLAELEADDYREALLCGVLHLRAHLLGRSRERTDVASRIRRLSRTPAEVRVESRIARIDIVEALHNDDTGEAAAGARRLIDTSRIIGEPRAEWLGMVALVSDPVVSGRFEEARTLASDAVIFGKRHEVGGSAEAYFAQEFIINWLAGDVADLAGTPPGSLAGSFVWSAGRALAFASLGDREAAEHLLVQHVHDVEHVGTDYLGLVGVAIAVEAATLTHTIQIGRAARRVLYEHMDDHIIVGLGVLDLGPASRYLALAEALDGDVATATERLEQLVRDASTGAVWANRAQHYLGVLSTGQPLSERSNPAGPLAAASLQRNGWLGRVQ
jgi:tetratricopeptide (TPR) repeat protein